VSCLKRLFYLVILDAVPTFKVMYNMGPNVQNQKIQKGLKSGSFFSSFAIEVPLSNMAASMLEQVTELFCYVWWLWLGQSDVVNIIGITICFYLYCTSFCSYDV
jgi:hypothetical protein